MRCPACSGAIATVDVDVVQCPTCGRKSRWVVLSLQDAVLRHRKPAVMVGAAWFMSAWMGLELVQMREAPPTEVWVPLAAAPLAAVIGTLWFGQALWRERRQLVLVDE